MKVAWVCIWALLGFSGQVLGADPLQSYNVDTSSITVSGLSAGGAMAMQYHVAFSSEIQGAAIYAGLPFACAKGGLTSANLCMYSPTTIVVANLAREINTLAGSNKIDAVSNLSGDKVFVFHGTKDTTVNPTAGHKLEQLYQEFAVVSENEYTIGAVHGFPTDFYGAACGSSSAATHYINNCNYHGAHIGLNYLLGGSLAPPASSAAGRLSEYDQREFGGTAAHSMDPTGYIYVPSGCQDRSRQCKLHIAFHGCQQSKTNLDDIYATKTGFMEVAEANNIIVLFPQAAPNIIAGNPNACWDWWGYLNANFLNKDGAQMKAVHDMMNRVSTCEASTGCNPSVTEPATTPSQGTNPTGNPITTPPTGSTGAPGECHDNDVSFRPFPGDCRYYTLCACGANVLLECASGLYFDPVLGKCNFMQLVPGCD
ncbi:Poly(3-hydroxyalkanoate) depolymerase C [Orchesella cincta]|uniref:Poly(3-hydroxyalkanoate) depolymerase C n=1 Tax=Orchesella cincta TaxID=48709 RepID=A0A1D2NC91_ORCCI|nr:Poly(3-hydroxyalkanoate) depolymerase C [Orchesella cincta]